MIAPESLDDIDLLESLDRAIGLPRELAVHLEKLVEGRRRHRALLAQLQALVQEQRRRERAPKVRHLIERTRTHAVHGDVGLLAATPNSRRVFNRTGDSLGSHSSGPNEITAWILGGVLSFLPREVWLALVAKSPALAQRFLVIEPGDDGGFENIAGLIERTGAQYPGALYDHMRLQVRIEADANARSGSAARVARDLEANGSRGKGLEEFGVSEPSGKSAARLGD